MSNLLRLIIISIVVGVLISAGSYLITKTEPNRCPFGALCNYEFLGYQKNYGYPRAYYQSYSMDKVNHSSGNFLGTSFVFDVAAWSFLVFIVLGIFNAANKRPRG